MRAIRILRNVLGISPGEIVKVTGMSRRELHRIETGQVEPHAWTIRAIDDAFDRVIHDRLIGSKKEAR